MEGENDPRKREIFFTFTRDFNGDTTGRNNREATGGEVTGIISGRGKSTV